MTELISTTGSKPELTPIVRIVNGAAFTNSRELAAFFGKRHDHILNSIDNLLEAGKPENPGLADMFVEVIIDRENGGRAMRCFDMDRNGFSLLAMGFTGAKALKWKLRYIEAFNKMETEIHRQANSGPMVDMNDPSALRGLLLSYSEKAIELQTQVNDLLPSKIAFDRIAEADGSLCVTEAAKALQVRPKDLFGFMRQNGWVYRRPGAAHDLGYQSKVVAGLLEHKVTTVLRADGSEKITEQVRVTPKGLTRLALVLHPVARAA